MQETTLLFVYGTLRKEYGDIGELEGPDKIVGGLFDMGPFPGYHPVDEEGYEVIGEVIRIQKEILPQLDKYEGVASGLYTRERVQTVGGRECWVYQISPIHVHLGTHIVSGDWFDRVALYIDLKLTPEQKMNDLLTRKELTKDDQKELEGLMARYELETEEKMEDTPYT